jgi:hypothetical protein
VAIDQSTGARSHQTIPMATLVDPTTSASGASGAVSAGLRAMVIGKVGSVGMIIVAFIQATGTVTAVLRVDKTGLE